MLVSSFDANLLVYGHNEAAPKHGTAKIFLEKLLGASSEQIVIVHQTLFELFSVLTSPAVFVRPLPALQAWGICQFYLTHPSIQIVAYELAVLPIVESLLRERPQRGKRIFDVIFAATLKYHGINRLYTRNIRDFQSYSFLEIINPL